MNSKLEICEIDYSVSPGGVNSFEVYSDPFDVPLFESESLTEAVAFCYNLGRDFTVRTLAQYYAEEALNV
jgi:hypothetical protein